MSKLLKVIVNTLLLLAILSAGALVIPPFAGITTLVSDGMGNTNISRGAVTYAKKTDTSSVATGDKILVDDNSGKYIYTIQSLDTAAGTASVKNVISGDTTEITVRATVSKVIVTIPVIGFLSMAAQSREGIMIIGLAILFLVILFILSEVWKRDEEEDEEEEEEGSRSKIQFAPLAVFCTFFVAELGDKTQLTAITFGANEGMSAALVVWIGCSLGLFAADILGMLVGYLLKSKTPDGLLNTLAFAIFSIFGVYTLYQGLKLIRRYVCPIPVWPILIAATVVFVVICFCLFIRREKEKND